MPKRSPPADVYERGKQPLRYTERTPPGGKQRGLAMDDKSSAMPKTTAGPARPGSERNSATMDARSSVPTSIQQGPNTRDHFGPLSYGEKNRREDNAELDDGSGTGRRQRGSFRDLRRM